VEKTSEESPNSVTLEFRYKAHFKQKVNSSYKKLLVTIVSLSHLGRKTKVYKFVFALFGLVLDIIFYYYVLFSL
jgi:hypothetical protein